MQATSFPHYRWILLSLLGTFWSHGTHCYGVVYIPIYHIFGPKLLVVLFEVMMSLLGRPRPCDKTKTILLDFGIYIMKKIPLRNLDKTCMYWPPCIDPSPLQLCFSQRNITHCPQYILSNKAIRAAKLIHSRVAKSPHSAQLFSFTFHEISISIDSIIMFCMKQCPRIEKKIPS